MATIRNFPPMTWTQFRAIKNGTRIVNYGYDQCVAVANLYHASVLKLPLPVNIESAYQWWTTFNRQPNLYNNYSKSERPVAGAIIVSRGGMYNSIDGHIGVVTHVNDDGTFNTLEQNAKAERYAHHYRRTKTAGVYGFLVPKNNPNSSSTNSTTEGALTMGSYTAEQSIPGGSTWRTLKINKKGDVTIKSGKFTGFAVSHVFIKGTPGQQVQIALAKDTFKNGATQKSVRSGTVSGVIPQRGILKLEVTSGFALKDSSERIRIKVANDSTSPVTVSYVSWDLLAGK